MGYVVIACIIYGIINWYSIPAEKPVEKRKDIEPKYRPIKK
jgi:hypothetical protein